MARKDYYEVLEVGRTATESDIKSAYRRLAKKFHPDTNPENPQAAERFKEVVEAYEVVGDAEKRRKYDRWGHDWEKMEKAGFASSSPFSGGYAGGTPGTAGDSEFSDIFESIFGATRPRRPRTSTSTNPGGAPPRDFGFNTRNTYARPQRGEDREQEIEVSLEEAFGGAERNLQITATEVCANCSGTGLKSGIRCTVCNGTGATTRQKRLQVRIPAGVDDGTKIKIANEGLSGVSGGPNGDLLLRVKLVPHAAFTRKGADLYTTITVPLYTALLGGEAVVSTPRGSKIALNVPADTQNGKSFRLTGQGMPVLNSSTTRGDMYVKMEVTLPAALSDQEKQLFEELRLLRPNG